MEVVTASSSALCAHLQGSTHRVSRTFHRGLFGVWVRATYGTQTPETSSASSQTTVSRFGNVFGET